MTAYNVPEGTRLRTYAILFSPETTSNGENLPICRLLLAMTKGFMVQYAPLDVHVHSFLAKKSERKHQFGGKMNE